MFCFIHRDKGTQSGSENDPGVNSQVVINTKYDLIYSLKIIPWKREKYEICERCLEYDYSQ